MSLTIKLFKKGVKLYLICVLLLTTLTTALTSELFVYKNKKSRENYMNVLIMHLDKNIFI